VQIILLAAIMRDRFQPCRSYVCGVIPVVTDIPSFRMITENGNVGILWKCGDAISFTEKLILEKPIKKNQKACR
jgi:hypothetical protein